MHVGQHIGNALVFDNGFTELDALTRVTKCSLKRGAGNAY